MPPVLILAAAAGAVYGAQALRREWRRVNRELEAAERDQALRDRATRPTLRKDRASGEWRPR